MNPTMLVQNVIFTAGKVWHLNKIEIGIKIIKEELNLKSS